MSTTSFLNRRFTALLLDGSVLERLAVGRVFEIYFPDCTLIQTGTISEAQSILEGADLDLVILDLLLPDGNGIDFLCDLKTIQPGVRIIIRSDLPDGDWAFAAISIGVDVRHGKSVGETELAASVRSLLGASTETNAFSGRIRAMSLLDVIQIKCLNRLSCELGVTSMAGSGSIFISGGEIIHSQTPALTGEAAFYELLSWKDGHVEDRELTQAPSRTITMKWEALCMNAAHSLDESR
ncbi:MAG: DUF4388 domain-containing protein [Limisphaerales bacterium]